MNHYKYIHIYIKVYLCIGWEGYNVDEMSDWTV